MIRITIVAMATLAGAAPAAAETKLPFIGAMIYATAEGCVKLKALAGGGGPNVQTVPEYLTETGFGGWEGGCEFTAFTEIETGKTFEVKMTCLEGEEENESIDTFVVDPATKAISVTEKGATTSTVFLPCDAPAPSFE